MSNERTEDMRLDDIFEKGKIALFSFLMRFPARRIQDA